MDNKDQLPYALETLEHELRHIIIDEQEHVVELSRLLEQEPAYAAAGTAAYANANRAKR